MELMYSLLDVYKSPTLLLMWHILLGLYINTPGLYSLHTLQHHMWHQEGLIHPHLSYMVIATKAMATLQLINYVIISHSRQTLLPGQDNLEWCYAR